LSSCLVHCLPAGKNPREKGRLWRIAVHRALRQGLIFFSNKPLTKIRAYD
jgi:hypothetical protein